MRKDQALKLAIDCIGRRIQVIAVNANLAKYYKCDDPVAINALKEKNGLIEAMAIISLEIKGIKGEK